MSKKNKLNLKEGLTLSSMILYVVLFFAFASFAIAISSNYNYRTLSDKGILIINEEISKLQYNLVMSAKQSDDVSKIGDKIVFSNNDEYEYKSEKKTLYKNGGILVQNLENFEIVTSEYDILTNFFVASLDQYKTYVGVKAKFKKYGQEKDSKFFVTSNNEEDLEYEIK